MTDTDPSDPEGFIWLYHKVGTCEIHCTMYIIKRVHHQTWFSFKKTDVAQKTAIYKLFDKSVAITDSSVINSFHHLQTHHSTEYGEYEKLKETTAQVSSTFIPCAFIACVHEQ